MFKKLRVCINISSIKKALEKIVQDREQRLDLRMEDVKEDYEGRLSETKKGDS